ncbi:MAG: hypothetical protein JW741_01660 [Sedimentisphaerales bacterium]|nr:hypothetical protein [Sedimentisphaerales bacterium]
MPEPLEDNIRENAQGPKRARGDAGEVEQHSLQDRIAADRYLASKEAAKPSPETGHEPSKSPPISWHNL